MSAHLLYSVEGEVAAYGYFFDSVTNVDDLLTQVKSGELNMCLLNPSFIAEPLQLQVAITRAVTNRSSGHMKTKSIFSEILFCLSPSNNIVDSFKRFGISEKATALIAVTFDLSDNIEDIVKGQLISFQQGIAKYSQTKDIISLYKIKDEEQKVSTLIDSIVTRIAAKHLL